MAAKRPLQIIFNRIYRGNSCRSFGALSENTMPSSSSQNLIDLEYQRSAHKYSLSLSFLFPGCVFVLLRVEICGVYVQFTILMEMFSISRIGFFFLTQVSDPSFAHLD